MYIMLRICLTATDCDLSTQNPPITPHLTKNGLQGLHNLSPLHPNVLCPASCSSSLPPLRGALVFLDLSSRAPVPGPLHSLSSGLGPHLLAQTRLLGEDSPDNSVSNGNSLQHSPALFPPLFFLCYLSPSTTLYDLH